MIFSEELTQKASLATKFFSKALSFPQSHFANGFILSGNDISLQYQLTLEIARYLNCTGDKTPECNCTNCSWIRQNAHPAVITISPLDYTEREQKIISVSQIRQLKNALNISSPYFRVIIFTDAKEIPSENSKFHAPKHPINPERIWSPASLSQKVFGASPSNALLKTLEEPESRVVFLFLTKNKNNLLSTIISRCQCINVLSPQKSDTDFDCIKPIIDNFPLKTIDDCIQCIKLFEEISKNIKEEILLNKLENYFKQLLENTAEDKDSTRNIIEIIKKIELTKNQLTNFVKEQNAIETLFFSLKN